MLCFTPDSNQVLLWELYWAKLYDLSKRTVISTVVPKDGKEIVLGSPSGELLVTDCADDSFVEIWNAIDNSLQVHLQICKCWEDSLPFVSGDHSVCGFICPEESLLHIQRISSNFEFLLIPVPPDSSLRPPHGVKARYLAFDYVHGSSLADRIYSLGVLTQGMADVMYELLPQARKLGLADLETGRCWLGLYGEGFHTFHPDGTRLLVFGDVGRFEYDLPPRWQSFTPWAWLALAVWMGLASIWWALRPRSVHRVQGTTTPASA
jgi:hypothetical protein